MKAVGFLWMIRGLPAFRVMFRLKNYGFGICPGATAVGVAPVMPDISYSIMRSKTMVDECEACICKETIYSDNMNNRITPEYITTLKPNEIFVFGSNLRGIHAGGAARMAHQHFGAEMGNGVGIQGQSYAIPTMQGGVETIKPYVDDFITYVKAHPELTLLVTPIGCGIAGFDTKDIAPLFKKATELKNIFLPQDFWDYLNEGEWN